MGKINRDLDRILARLCDLISERGYTQLEVQEALGWGRIYINQLVNRQKSLRVEHVLAILGVIGVEPADFFDEIYRFRRPTPTEDTAIAEVRRLRQRFDALAGALIKKGLVTASELALAIEKNRRAQQTPPRRIGEPEEPR